MYFFHSSEIYKEFTMMLDHLYHQSISNPLTPTIPSKPGPPLQMASTTTITPAKDIVRYYSFYFCYMIPSNIRSAF